MGTLNPLFRFRRRVYFIYAVILIFVVALTHQKLYPSSPYAQYSTYSLDIASTTYGQVKGYITSRVEDVFENTLYTDGVDVYSEFNFSMPCQGFPETDGIMLVMKTGATEAFDKLPTQLLTSLQCLPDFLLFSDMEQQIGAYHVHDALDTVVESIKAHNEDFDLYRSQRECPISQKACVDPRQNAKSAWNLDKYKFLHVMDKAWEMRPDENWYVFAEADSYVFWSNLVAWLKEGGFGDLNPKEKLYMGSVAMLGGKGFAHGGSGYVLSGAALKRLVEGGKGVASRFDHLAHENCCGDALLSMALEENGGTKVNQLHPHFNGEKPSTLPYGPTHWCEPIFTMHHMDSEEIMQVWQLEQTRKSDGLLLIKDLYTALVAPKMEVYRPDWDNLSSDICYEDPSRYEDLKGDNGGTKFNGKTKISGLSEIEKSAFKSFEDCAKVCEQEDIEEIEDENNMEEDEEAKELAELMLKGEELKKEKEGGDDGIGQKHLQRKNNNQIQRRGGRSDGTGPIPTSKDNKSTTATTETADAKATGKDKEEGLTEEEESRAKAYLEYQAKKQEVMDKRRDKKCFQYRWEKGICCTSKSFKLGVPKRNASDKREDKVLSGWDLKGINDWIEAMGECEPKWKTWRPEGTHDESTA